MKRQLMLHHVFDRGYSDSENALGGGNTTAAEGSFNLMRLGEGFNLPFQGVAPLGPQTGAELMFQIGDTWGGIKEQQGNASGSVVEDFDQKMYAIGVGKPMKEGVTIQRRYGTITINAQNIDNNTDVITYSTTLPVQIQTGGVIYFSGSTPTGASVNVAYYVRRLSNTTLSLHTTYTGAITNTDRLNLTQSVGLLNCLMQYGADITLSSVLQVASVPVLDVNGKIAIYKFYDQANLETPQAPSMSIVAPSPAYTGLVKDEIAVKVAAIRYREDEGNLTTLTAPARSLASASSGVSRGAVGNPITVRFPPPVDGQTHWAVFATRQGFGTSGVYYRVGYRTTSVGTDTEWIYGIPESVVAATGTRNLIFDFTDADLLPEDAWIYDYPPPAGSHFLRMENVGIVLGAYPEGGTIGAVSLPNYFESYNPRHLLYFPEDIVGVLHKEFESQAIVACRNSVHALEYVGNRGDNLPPVRVTTIMPDTGIKNAQNWAVGGSTIAMWIEGTGIAVLDKDGRVDYEFGREVARFTKNWNADDVVVMYDPDTLSFIFAYQNVFVSFCQQSLAWSDPVYLNETYTQSGRMSGTWKSGVQVKGELYCTIEDNDLLVTHRFNRNDATLRSNVCEIGRWQKLVSAGRSANIYEISIATEQGVADSTRIPVIIGLHSNLFPTHVRGASITDTTLFLPSGINTGDAWIGKKVVLFNPNIGGAGVDYLITTIVSTDSSQIELEDNVYAGGNNLFVLIGEDFFTETPISGKSQHHYNVFPALQEARSYCVSVYMGCFKGSQPQITGNVLEVDVFGTGSRTSEAKI